MFDAGPCGVLSGRAFIDITDAVEFGRPMCLAVAVRDSSGMGGIYKRVWVMLEE